MKKIINFFNKYFIWFLFLIPVIYILTRTVIVDNDIWLDSLKCEWWKSSEGLTDEEEIKAFKKLLQDNCAYQTEVDFN